MNAALRLLHAGPNWELVTMRTGVWKCDESMGVVVCVRQMTMCSFCGETIDLRAPASSDDGRDNPVIDDLHATKITRRVK